MMGGSQVNGLQLLTGGDADMIIGYDFQTLTAVEHGLPVVTVGASFQFDLQGIMAHPDVRTLADLKGRKILILSTAHGSYWPWLKERFGFTDDQAAAYTFNLQPFFADMTLAQQAYATSEPFQAQVHNIPINFFLFAKYGYPLYGTTVVTTNPYLQANPTVVARFVRASEGRLAELSRKPGSRERAHQSRQPENCGRPAGVQRLSNESDRGRHGRRCREAGASGS
jgi:NitT/TauT family transport system substrate-binding protein